jgi:AraC-like DNA-binding protein
VHCYWVLRCESAADATVDYRIVSDGCIDLFVNCTSFEGLFIAGATGLAAVVPITGRTVYFGIRFLPGRVTSMLPVQLREISGQMIASSDLWGNRLERFEADLFAAPSSAARLRIADAFLQSQLRSTGRTPDPRITASLDTIYRHRGQLRLDKHVAHAVSPRQLRRLFDHHIGIRPKSFARIVRFQSMLQTMLRVPEGEWGQRCLDFGYYDQAHFIHEFKMFSGQPPMSSNFS